MIVDGYKVDEPAIADVIEKLTEADGCVSAPGQIRYLVEASRILCANIAMLAHDAGYAEALRDNVSPRNEGRNEGTKPE